MHRLRKLIAILGAGLGLAATTVGANAAPALPNSMASTGDSISRAFDATWWGCFLTDCPGYSWSTGTSTTVNSQYNRILAHNPAIRGFNYNDSKTGAKMADLDGQLKTAAAQNVGYVTVLMGANDVCASTMTDTGTFQAELAAALADFFAADPNSVMYVSSLPSLRQLYTLLSGNSNAVNTWRTFRICQSYLPPGGTDASRAAGDAQEVAFNNILGSVCAQYGSHCLYDGGAGYSEFKFSTADVSTVDYFHPSVTGQRDVAAFTWAHSYWPAM